MLLAFPQFKMTVLKWCLCLSFLVAVLSDELPKTSQLFEITNVKFLPYLKQELPELSEIAKRLSTASERAKVAVLNEYVDEVLVNLNEFIIKTGLDPIPLPGFEENFRWTIFFGWVALNDGWMRGMSTIERKGDVTITYSYPDIKLHMVLGFSNLSFKYHYAAKLMGLGPSGSADGEAKGSKFTIDLNLNMVNLKANLDKFRLNTIGKLSIEFSGSTVGDIANVLISVVLPILKPIINLVLDGFITDGLNAILGAYNNAICTILADCPEPIVNTVYKQLH